MSVNSITTDRVVQNVLKIGGVCSVLAAVAIIAGITTGNGEVNVLTQAGIFVMAAWAVSFIVALIMAAVKRN